MMFPYPKQFPKAGRLWPADKSAFIVEIPELNKMGIFTSTRHNPDQLAMVVYWFNGHLTHAIGRFSRSRKCPQRHTAWLTPLGSDQEVAVEDRAIYFLQATFPMPLPAMRQTV